MNQIETVDDGDEIIIKLTKDLRDAAKLIGQKQARFLVSRYYKCQEDRIRAEGQLRSMGETNNALIDWLCVKSRNLEDQVRNALGVYSQTTVVGRWSRSVTGIGPVLAAGLMAHIDITRAPTVGHIWSFAGLDPNKKWEKATKRPWNAELKTLCWKIGESFVKVSGLEKAFYGHLYAQRKNEECTKNDEGAFKEQALVKAEIVGKDTDAYPWNSGCYPTGTFRTCLGLMDEKARKKFLEEKRGEPGTGTPMLAPAHIHARAKRYAMKLFLAHWHEVAYKDFYKKDPPMPYPIAILGHAHKIDPSRGVGDDESES